MSASATLVILVLGALMGLLGQGSRAVVGLKTMSDDAKSLGVSSTDLFQAARLLISLAIGVLVGLAAALIYIMSNPSGTPDWHVLLGFAAAGYVGTDFLEGFISKYLAPTVRPTSNIAALNHSVLILKDEPGQKEQAIMDCITSWLRNDGKLAKNKEADPEGTMNGTYHFNGPPEIATFLKGISIGLIGRDYTYDYTKDLPLAVLTQLSTATITAVAYQIGKHTTYTPGGFSV